MPAKHKFSHSSEERQRRSFSTEFKIRKVREIEQKVTTISEMSRIYQVRVNSIYKWLDKFGVQEKKPERTIVESQSDTRRIAALEQRIAELERTVGQKQMQLEFKDKMIELAEATYGVDIKKKCSTLPSTGSSGTDSNFP
jgi:transposase-like protein